MTAPEPALQRPQRRRLGRSLGERLVLSLGVIGTVVALLSAGVLAWGLDRWEAIDTVKVDVAGPAEKGEPSNWLLIGTDSREGIDESDPNAGFMLGEGAPIGKRTDMIIVARIDPEGQIVHLLSIPRDLWVNYPSGKEGRINGVFNGDHPEQDLITTVEQTFGLEINHYAEINFVGFQDIVDNLGGVPVWFDKPMRDSGSGLSIQNAGCHVLDGSQSLAFARGRELEYFADGKWRTDGTGDLGRSSRQQYFLRRLASTVVARFDVTQVATIDRVLTAGGENFTKDQTIGPRDLLSLASTFGGLQPEQIIGHALPVYDFRSDGGAAVLGLEEELAQPILDLFRGIDPTAPPSTSTTVRGAVTVIVLNGSRTPGQATLVSDALAAVGFTMGVADNSPTLERTAIRYPSAMVDAAVDLASYLATDPDFVADETLTEIQLITGADFTELLAVPRSGVPAPATTTTTAPPVSVAPESTIGVVPGPSPAGTTCE
ncbi:MAG: LCP family protein [Actinomycetota bacterium]|nr:LCP family protein [Actinomycetota bacterium]